MNSSANISANFQIQDVVEQGATLVEKAVDIHVIDGAEYMARWYYSPRDADLMIWFNIENGIDRYQLNSSGQIVDWSQAEGLKTGFIVELELTGTMLAKNDREIAETIQFDLELNGPARLRAKTIVENSAALPLTVREVILQSLELDSPGLAPMSRLRAVSSSRNRFWGRFKRWTIGV